MIETYMIATDSAKLCEQWPNSCPSPSSAFRMLEIRGFDPNSKTLVVLIYSSRACWMANFSPPDVCPKVQSQVFRGVGYKASRWGTVSSAFCHQEAPS